MLASNFLTAFATKISLFQPYAFTLLPYYLIHFTNSLP